jgi:hypothetical protein
MLLVDCARFGYDQLPLGDDAADASGLAEGGSAGTSAAGSGPSGGAGGNAGTSTSIAGASGSPGGAGGSGEGGGAGGAARDGGATEPVTCFDGALNQDESQVDCGGASCPPCPCMISAPELMGNPNLAGNDILAVSLSGDALTLYIGGRVQGGTRPVGVTTRPGRDDDFALASLLAAPVNSSPAVEGTPFLTRDGLALVFYSERSGGQGNGDLYASRRASAGATFDTLIVLDSLNSGQRDHAPWVSPDTLTVYFASSRASPTDDLWRATRSSLDVDFSSPVAVAELNSDANDAGVTFSDDGLVAYFASDRPGGLGGMDLYRAARARTSDPFSAPELVPGLNTPADDAAPQLTADGRELFFVSNRNGGESQLFRALSSCP